LLSKPLLLRILRRQRRTRGLSFCHSERVSVQPDKLPTAPRRRIDTEHLFTYVDGDGGDGSVVEDSTTTATKFLIFTNRCQTAASPKASFFVVKILIIILKVFIDAAPLLFLSFYCCRA
jgi:hypothetical protein